MRKVKVIEIMSEIGAGTRGASMGMNALKVACLNKQSSFFKDNPVHVVKTHNEVLFTTNRFPFAKHIDSIYENLRATCENISSSINKDTLPIVISGDHSTAAGTIAGIKKHIQDKRLGVIWIDAHADLHTPYTTPSGNMHGMPLGMAFATDNLDSKINTPVQDTVEYWEKIKNLGFEGPKLKPEDLVFISVRDTEKPENLFIEKNKIKNFTTKEVNDLGIKEVVKQTLEKLKDCDFIYISFDVDSIDSKFSMGTGTPVPDGLTPEQAIELNTLLVRDPKTIVWEMVEINPTLDTENKMANMAFDVLTSVTNTIN